MPDAGKPGSIYQTSAWKRSMRAIVFGRDGYRCRRCGAAGKQRGGSATLSMQHLLPEKVRLALRRPLTADDLVTLCLVCHGKADGGRRYR